MNLYGMVGNDCLNKVDFLGLEEMIEIDVYYADPVQDKFLDAVRVLFKELSGNDSTPAGSLKDIEKDLEKQECGPGKCIKNIYMGYHGTTQGAWVFKKGEVAQEDELQNDEKEGASLGKMFKKYTCKECHIYFFSCGGLNSKYAKALAKESGCTVHGFKRGLLQLAWKRSFGKTVWSWQNIEAPTSWDPQGNEKMGYGVMQSMIVTDHKHRSCNDHGGIGILQNGEIPPSSTFSGSWILPPFGRSNFQSVRSGTSPASIAISQLP